MLLGPGTFTADEEACGRPMEGWRGDWAHQISHEAKSYGELPDRRQRDKAELTRGAKIRVPSNVEVGCARLQSCQELTQKSAPPADRGEAHQKTLRM
jgi:hypothetical protein